MVESIFFLLKFKIIGYMTLFFKFPIENILKDFKYSNCIFGQIFQSDQKQQ